MRRLLAAYAKEEAGGHRMRISVVGIGYVGAVSAACLARDGHSVVCADPNSRKVGQTRLGVAPVLEPGLSELMRAEVASGRLSATTSTAEAVRDTEVSLVCVGTPSAPNGALDTQYVLRCAEEIGEALKHKQARKSVVVRSTLLPGTMTSQVIPTLERASNLRAGVDFGVAYYPEFLRESTALADYYAPGVVVFGQLEGDEETIQQLAQICAAVPIQPTIVSLFEAEAVKYANNTWHALKISYANEIGNICKAGGMDGHRVMEILCADTKLNISPAYLKPGFAFGGSCLPKDLRAIRHRARELDVPTPVLDSLLTANEAQLSKAVAMVARTGVKRVGLAGLSFKDNTDDLRESPLVELAERLLGKGYEVRIFDSCVDLDDLTGSNLTFVHMHSPHLATLLVPSAQALIDHAEVIVVGKREAAVLALLDGRPDLHVVDLVRISRTRRSEGRYDGICW